MNENLASIKEMAQAIVAKQAVRPGYEAVFVEVATRWEYINSPEVAAYLLGVVNELVDRKARKIGTTRLANYIMAQAKSRSNAIDTERAAALMEVIGILICGGNIVIEKIQEKFDDMRVCMITQNILRAYAQLCKIRKQFGAGSNAELQALKSMFNLKA